MTFHAETSEFRLGVNEGWSATSATILRTPPDFPTLQMAQDWSRSLVILDPRTLGRECLARAFATRRVRMEVAAFASMQEWKSVKDLHSPLGAILFNLSGRSFADPEVVSEITQLVSDFHPVPVVVLADEGDVTEIFTALECGVRGYIPATVGIDACIEAINLAIAGGVFVPASSLFALRQALDPSFREAKPISSVFTPREAAVVEALRRGKANKIIAYELDMCESTVKVHIRHIMKKMKATNRTEVAYKINSLFNSEEAAS
ncbi:LuxR C-terminal-related transcriptional regulator [Chelativorans alearense]|uniref:LuxR C-terminal-related transcriptional regulator n=1 Tax=Chelativorans alearense TaxID=2681495 RepID=UPI001FEB4025|nr:response regulator transcription factor [Chelativorans alearense]